MKIVCSKNKGYQWYEREGIHFRGYIQNDKTCLMGEEAILFLKTLCSYSDFKNYLASAYGCFSIIIERNEEQWLAVDIARSMPLYYDKNLTIVSDSAEAIRQELGISYSQVDETRTLEFYTTSYIVGINTIYSDIKQLNIGMVAKVDHNSIFTEYYYIHKNEIKEYTREEALTELYVKTERAISRIKRVVGNRQIVISLSGGYDSRYLVCSLKDHGIENVVCYSYGGSNSFEIVQAKKVAEALGYKWFCIEYDDKSVKELASKKMNDYFDYVKDYDYIAYIQNYVAFERLSGLGVIEPDAIVLTGLCNDMPTGFYIPEKEEIIQYSLNIHGCAEFVYDKRFIKFTLEDSVKEKFISEIENDLFEWGLKVYDYDTFVHACDCANTAYIHSRSFLHMNCVHEFFNHEWLLLCWDKELLNFWYSLPVSLRIHQNLYEEYITERIGKKYGVGTKKTIPTLTNNSKLSSLIRHYGSRIVHSLYRVGIPIKRKTDVNNFSALEVVLYRKIKEKEAIKSQYAAICLLLTVYILELRHGTQWYKKIRRMILD